MKSLARLLPLLLACALLSSAGCSRALYKFAYNNADTYVIRKVDSYFDLNDSQSRMVRASVKRLHTWHRRAELPRYVALMREISRRGRSGITPAYVRSVSARLRRRQTSLYRRAIPDIAAFLSTLTPAQIEHFRKRLPEFNKDARRKAVMSRRARLAERVEKSINYIEDWTGSLSDEQKSSVRRLVVGLPDTARACYRFRRERQAELIALLRQRPGRAAIQARLRRWLIDRERNYPAYYRRGVYRWRTDGQVFFVKLDRLMTASQRIKALGRLDDLANDFRSLVQ